MTHFLCRRAENVRFVISVLFIALAMTGCDRFNDSLIKGLEEEKSYTRHAMEYHREHPDQRRGDKVLEIWSKADYLAQSVAKQPVTENSARFSDRIQFLPDNLKQENGKPFCVIQFPGTVLVLWPPLRPFDSCTLSLAPTPRDVSQIKSGDLQFSGKTDAWVYVLKSSE
jgi:hypothetical protein